MVVVTSAGNDGEDGDRDGYVDENSVTATWVTFTDTLPSGVTTFVEPSSPPCDGETTPVSGGFACRMQGGSLSVGAGITYTLI